MLEDAEKYKKQDDQQREKITLRNQLERYAFNVRQAVADVGEGGLSDVEKSFLRNNAQETIKWLDDNPDSKPEEYKAKHLDLQKNCNPYLLKMIRNSWLNKQNQECRTQEKKRFEKTANNKF